ncbi:crossover junction endodeoxyribonuclease RuvC [Patescibacteria group bacterium]|nr:crossover junction endodeoxyribonuclease RuvC [Patescibacteria group bacterium]
MLILGIDPGTSIVGWALVRYDGRNLSLIKSGTVTNPPRTGQPEKLIHIYKETASLLQSEKPDCVALEKLFFFKNDKTAMSVAEARGVIVLTSALCRTTLYEYTPLEVKMAVTGYGRATKSQVQTMVKTILGLPKPIASDDANDAAAIAITAAHHQKFYQKIKTSQ